MLPTREELRAMKETDIMEAERERLAEIGGIQIDESKSMDDRIRDYLEQVHNPYVVKAGEYVLKFRYADCGMTMEDCMAEYVSKLAQICW